MIAAFIPQRLSPVHYRFYIEQSFKCLHDHYAVTLYQRCDVQCERHVRGVQFAELRYLFDIRRALKSHDIMMFVEREENA
jgi:hypothetical protein